MSGKHVAGFIHVGNVFAVIALMSVLKHVVYAAFRREKDLYLLVGDPKRVKVYLVAGF